MKLFEAFFLSLVASLFAGAFLFLGIPFLWYFIAEDRPATFIDSEMLVIVLAFYAIYAVIQLLLSIINLIQAIHLRSIGALTFTGRKILSNFLIAELALYLVVFVALVVVVSVPEIVPAALIFSIPYVICCTISVFIFRWLLKKVINTDIISSDAEIK
jgi:hypothetical protein